MNFTTHGMGEECNSIDMFGRRKKMRSEILFNMSSLVWLSVWSEGKQYPQKFLNG